MNKLLQVGICVFVLTFFALLFVLPPVWAAGGYTLMAAVTYNSAVSVIQNERITDSPAETTIFPCFLLQHGRFSTSAPFVFFLLETDKTTY